MSDAIARKWHDLLVAAEPVDRGRAESALGAAYRAAGLAEPGQFLWCASPLEAVWAVLVLIGDGESCNVPLLDAVRRKAGGKEKLAAVRAGVAANLGISPLTPRSGGSLLRPRIEGPSPPTQADSLRIT